MAAAPVGSPMRSATLPHRHQFGRRLLLLNWRDPWHPRAGGAELVTLRIMERLAGRGWLVEWFSALYPGASRTSVSHGIKFSRGGTQSTVHLRALLRYGRCAQYDVVVDEINTVPFLAPLYSSRPVIAFVHQLAREVWLYEARPPLSFLGYLAEPVYLRAYRRVPIITVSRSSRGSLEAMGLRGPMCVIPEAVDEACDATVPKKDEEHDVIVLGRVTPSKRIEHSIKAAGMLRETGWRGRLHVTGSGESSYLRRLKALAGRLRVSDQVVFEGAVADDRRAELLRACSLLWMTSVREGWGLVVTEAARHGTPAVVYDVPGLRDAVIDGATGRVVEPTPEALARATLAVLKDRERYAAEALRVARALDWESTALAFENFVVSSTYGPRPTALVSCDRR